jgi:hypothetical protein
MTDTGCRRAAQERGSVGDSWFGRGWLAARSVGRAGLSHTGGARDALYGARLARTVGWTVGSR